MAQPASPDRVHLVAGGFPRGTAAGHDIDYARLRILEALHDEVGAEARVAPDFGDLEAWLPRTRGLISYVAGPFPDADQCALLDDWLIAGGRWLALHGTSGGQAIPRQDGKPGREMARKPHHEVLGCFFLNHPPIRAFQVDVQGSQHLLTEHLPNSFEVSDELYLLELLDRDNSRVLLSTRSLPATDPAPRSFGFTYQEDTSIEPDGVTRPLAYVRQRGAGEIVYLALGHCHTPTTNIQPFVDASVDPDGVTPLSFRGAWETEAFGQLLKNGVRWLTQTGESSSDL